MIMSSEINEIAAALSAAQGIIKNPEKTRLNPHFKSKYADLAGGLDCIRPALSANGIAIVQATDINRDGVVILTTRLVHASGQYFGCTYPVGPAGDHQKLASSLTYAKRQSLFSLVGVCGDDDTDGEGIANGDSTPITAAQVNELREKIEEVGADEQRFLRYLRIGSLAVLPAADFGKALQSLEAKKASAA